jgi:hypothetical protein
VPDQRAHGRHVGPTHKDSIRWRCCHIGQIGRLSRRATTV